MDGWLCSSSAGWWEGINFSAEPSQISKTDQAVHQEVPRLQGLRSASLNKAWYQSEQELQQFAPDKWLKSLNFCSQGNAGLLTRLPGSVENRSRKEISKELGALKAK